MRSPSRLNLSPRCPSAVAAVMTVALLVTACGTSGRELRDPPPGATAPPRPSSTSTTTPTTVNPTGLSIVSPAWAPGGEIPGTFACDGAAVSPPLTVGGVTDDVVELVVVVTSVAADPVRWVVGGLGAETAVIEQGAVPEGAVVALNSAGEPTWAAPCPAPGATQYLDFSVYALTSPSGITATTSATETEALVASSAVAKAVMTGTYTRQA